MDEFTVHDVTLQDQTRLASGKAAHVKLLTFYVGSHGPFFWTIPQEEYSAQRVQDYIGAQVSDLRRIAGAVY